MGEISRGELNVFFLIKPYVSEMFDVGTYTDVDYWFLHPTAKYHFFEPMEAPYSELIKLVGKKENIKINNVGCSNVKGIEKLYRNISSTIIKTTDIVTHLDDFEEVSMIRLDEYIEENNITKFDFIKIDTEGSEWLVLDGLGKYLNKFKFIQVEYGGTYKDVPFGDRKLLLKDIFEKLNGYKAVNLERRQFHSEYNELLENYAYANYLFYKPNYHNLLLEI